MKDGICPKCSATTIIPRVYIPERALGQTDQSLAVEFHENPDRIVSQGIRRYRIRAWICGTCGYTEIYTTHARKLYAAYLEAQRRQ